MAIRGIFFLALVLQIPLAIHAAEEMPERRQAMPPPPPGIKENKEQPPPRRRVPAIIPQTVPPPASTAQFPTPRPPTTLPPPSARPAPPDRPAAVTACDPAGCWDSGGTRYNSGNGTTYLNSAGKLCTRNGAWMQCF